VTPKPTPKFRQMVIDAFDDNINEASQRHE
jgi:hypothetical protein